MMDAKNIGIELTSKVNPRAAGVSGRTRRAGGVNITPPPGYLRNEAP